MEVELNQSLNALVPGGQIPKGRINISGAKNSATRLLAASLICDENVEIRNFPTALLDVRHKARFISDCGGEIRFDNENEIIHIDNQSFTNQYLGYYNYPVRTTYLFAAGLVKKSNTAYIPYPGGCNLGNRGYDQHIMVWEKLGATVIERNNYIEIKTQNGFIPGEIDFPISTIGGTENALICASTISGLTKIRNAYISPEVHDLISFLQSMGVNIKVIGNSYIEVYGSKYLRGAIHTVIPDRIEALTWLVYGALSKGDIIINNVPFASMEIPLKHIEEAGIDFYRNKNSIRISPDCLDLGLVHPFELATGAHPGVISDMQPFYVLLGLYANGISRIYDYRYPKRIKYCEQLEKFYPSGLKWEEGKITTFGINRMTPQASEVYSTDLRGSMALLLGALLCKEGVSNISGIDMALRGYNNLNKKLKGIKVHIDLLPQNP